MTTERIDPYAILGLARDATQAQISAAYRTLLRRYHPDTRTPADTGHDARADAALQHVLTAYAVLADPARRSNYDQQTSPRSVARPHPGTAVPPATATPVRRPTPPCRTSPLDTLPNRHQPVISASSRPPTAVRPHDRPRRAARSLRGRARTSRRDGGQLAGMGRCGRVLPLTRCSHSPPRDRSRDDHCDMVIR